MRAGTGAFDDVHIERLLKSFDEGHICIADGERANATCSQHGNGEFTGRGLAISAGHRKDRSGPSVTLLLRCVCDFDLTEMVTPARCAFDEAVMFWHTGAGAMRSN